MENFFFAQWCFRGCCNPGKKKKVDFKYFNGLLVCQKKAHKKPTQNHFIVMTITSD